MNDMERRVFMKGASMGMLSFAVGGVEILMTPGEARARATCRFARSRPRKPRR